MVVHSPGLQELALSKISVDTEAVAIGNCNTVHRSFRLMATRCFYFVPINVLVIAKCPHSVDSIYLFVIYLFLLL